MKKIINDPNKYLSEMLEGIYIAHQNQLTYVNDDPQCLVTKTKKAGDVYKRQVMSFVNLI